MRCTDHVRNTVWAQGDFNHDGKVDVGDLGILATNYGQTLGGGGASAAASPAMASRTPVASTMALATSAEPFAASAASAAAAPSLGLLFNSRLIDWAEASLAEVTQAR